MKESKQSIFDSYIVNLVLLYLEGDSPDTILSLNILYTFKRNHEFVAIFDYLIKFPAN